MLDWKRTIAGPACVLLAGALMVWPGSPARALDQLPVLAEWKSPDASGQTSGIAISRDGRYVLSGYYERAVLWDAQSGRSLSVLRGHTGDVVVAFLDGQRAATADPKKGIMVWDIASGRQLSSRTLKNSDRLAAAPDSSRLATAGFDDQAVWVWDAANGRQVWMQDKLTGWPTGLTYSPDGKLLVTGQRTSISFWDAASGAPVAKVALNSQVWAVAVAPDNRIVAAAEPTAIRVIDIESKKETGAIRSEGDPWFQDVAFLPSGRHVATADIKGQLLIGALATREFVAKAPDSQVRSQRVAIAPDGSRAYVGRANGTIQIIDLASLR